MPGAQMIRFFSEQRGVTAVEYALIASLVLVVAIPSMVMMGDAMKENLYDVIGSLASLI
jgi:Flp pilus assembly pilin Flp